MDSVTYFLVPDKTKRESIILDHMCFDTNFVNSNADDFKNLFDEYATKNDEDLLLAFLNSLDETLQDDINNRITEDMIFVQVWMVFIKFMQLDSMEKYDKMKEEIKTRITPKMFPQQDISKMAVRFKKIAKELTAAGLYDQQLTMYMLDSFLTANGGQDYLHQLRNLRPKLSLAINTSRYKTAKEQQKHLEDEEVSFEHICDKADSLYIMEIERKVWPPAATRRDTRVAPANFGANIAGSEEATQLFVNALIQQMKQTAPSGNCHNCGKPGHWYKDCPLPKQGNQAARGNGLVRGGKHGRGQQGQRSGRGGRFGGRGPQRNFGGRGNSNSRGGNERNWRKIPPVNGITTKQSPDGTTVHWCTKCKKWSTHKAEDHNRNNNNQGQQQANLAANFLHFDPSAWMAIPILPEEAIDGMVDEPDYQSQGSEEDEALWNVNLSGETRSVNLVTDESNNNVTQETVESDQESLPPPLVE
jgi:hypothetical protein